MPLFECCGGRVSTTIGTTRRNPRPVSYYEFNWIRRESALSIIGAILKCLCCTFGVFACIARDQIRSDSVLFTIFPAYSRSFYCTQKREFNSGRQEEIIRVLRSIGTSQWRLVPSSIRTFCTHRAIVRSC